MKSKGTITAECVGTILRRELYTTFVLRQPTTPVRSTVATAVEKSIVVIVGSF